MAQQRPCEVHDRVFGDATPRAVKFCPRCGAWLCDSCRGRYSLRGVAAALRLAEDLGLGSGRLKSAEERS